MKCAEILHCCWFCCCCCSATGWQFAAPTWADTSIWSPQTSCASEWVKERSLCRPPTSWGWSWLRLRLRVQTRGRSGLQSQRMLMSMTRQLPDSTGNCCCCAWGVAAVVVDSSPHLRPEALQMSWNCNCCCCSCSCSCSWFTCNLIKCHRFFRLIKQQRQERGRIEYYKDAAWTWISLSCNSSTTDEYIMIIYQTMPWSMPMFRSIECGQWTNTWINVKWKGGGWKGEGERKLYAPKSAYDVGSFIAAIHMLLFVYASLSRIHLKCIERGTVNRRCRCRCGDVKMSKTSSQRLNNWGGNAELKKQRTVEL